MRTMPMKRCGMTLLAGVLVAFLTGAAASADVPYTLRAGMDNIVMPDNAVMPVWGFADVNADNVVRLPGPVLVANAGDNLVITLVNDLPDNVTSVSIVIPGQRMPVADDGSGLSPVFDNNSPPRVQSYTRETPPGGSFTYRFPNLKTGTYLYESGADPSLQVQMGLYGALIVRPADPGQAYDNTATNPNTAFDNEVVLLYSEIDPFLHEAVADNTYGTDAHPSTIEFEPKYFLVNGRPYSQPYTPVPIGGVGGNGTLLRFLNAGLVTHAPSFPETYVSVIAEDGNLLPYPRMNHTVLLPAGKTLDAILVPVEARKISLFDRRMFVTNNGAFPGGMITFLAVSGADIAGPAIDNNVVLTPDPALGISPVVLTASADDTGTGGSGVVAAEWFTDNTVLEGEGFPMTGTFGTPVVSDLTAYIPLSSVPADNTIYIRGQDAEGNWSLPVPVLVAKGASSPLSITETGFYGGNKLVVKARSSAAPAGSDVLTATDGTGTVLGTMIYRSGQDIYEGDFWRSDGKPDSVTVTSSGGGSVTAPVPYP